MTHSLAQETQLTCPNCGQQFNAEIWLIVDIAERPDLLDRLRAGRLHDLPCPHCGHAGQVDAPLLLLRPQAAPPLLFSPAQGTTEEQDQEQANGLLNELRQRLGPAWQEEWLADGLNGIPRPMLAAALSDNPEAALRQMAEKAEQELKRLQQEDPETYRQLEEAARQQAEAAQEGGESQAPRTPPAGLTGEQAQALSDSLVAWIQQGTLEDAETYLTKHKAELLTGEAEAVMTDLVQTYPQLTDQQQRLARAREAGIAAMYAEIRQQRFQEALANPENLSPALQEVLAELAQSGVEINSQEDLERALAARPDLRAKLAAAAGQGSSGPAVPPHFQADIQKAQAGEQRYRQRGDRRGLDEAAAAWERIFNHPDFSAAPERFQLAVLNDGGGVFLRRYWAAGQIGDLNQALEMWQQAVAATPPDSPDLPSLLNNLGTGLSARYGRTGRLEDLQEAIRVYQQAVAATPPDSPDLPSRLNNLGTGLRDRWRREDAEKDQKAQDEKEGIHAYAKACESGQDRHPEAILTASRSWGRWALERRGWAEADRALAFGRESIRRLLAAQHRRGAKLAWLRDAQSLPILAAYALAQLDRAGEAVHILERGRGRLLRESLERNRRDLDNLPALGFQSLHDAYTQAAAHYDKLLAPAAPGQTPPAAAELDAARHAVNEAVQAIRNQAGQEHEPYRYFMDALPLKHILELAREAPIVYLLAAPAGGLALIVSADGVQALPLPRLTEEALQARVWGQAGEASYLRAYDAWRQDTKNEDKLNTWQAALDDTARWLWDAVMGDLIPTLQSQNARHARLIPTGLLGLLPLHAAWTPDDSLPAQRRYALDDITFTYLPNSHALWESQQAAARPANRLLVIENPDGSLPFGGEATDAAREQMPNYDHFGPGQINRQTAINALSNYDVLYFYTHGIAAFGAPDQSGLSLSGSESLSLADILGMRFPSARLAVLAACETSIPANLNALDEFVSLPGGFVQAGIPGVIGSQWSVLALSTAMLMTLFFENWQKKGMAIPQALTLAQTTLRDSINARLKDRFKTDLVQQFQLTPEVADILFKEAALGDYSHPFYWAGFIFVGC